jgi:tetratricopeptide (TPR) repeat protein
MGPLLLSSFSTLFGLCGMRRAVTFMALWLGMMIPAPVLAVGAADAILVQANAAITSGQYEAARTLAVSGLAEPGQDVLTRCRLLVTRGLAHQALGNTEQALVDFTEALQGTILSGEERARALFARGLTLDVQGRLDLAVGDYSAALSFVARAPYALNNRANVYRRQGRFAEARRDYTAALEANTPDPQYPNFGLGQIAEAEGDLQAARFFYSRALTADPAFALARARLAAMGAPVEGLAGLPTDTGIIVLRPPGTRTAEAPVVLKPPPEEKIGARPAVPSPSSPTPIVRVAEPARPAQPRPGQGAPLRPAIMENSPPAAPAAGPLVQLGAWRSEAEAQAGWVAAQGAAGGLLDGLTPVIVTVVLPGRGTFHRLRVRAQGAAGSFCRALETRGLACLPVRD